MEINKEQILHALTHVVYPGLEKNLVDLQMISEVEVLEKIINLKIKLPAQSPFKKSLEKACKEALSIYVSKNLEINISFDVPEVKQKVNESKPLSKVKNIIAIASGKGGVGKSTVAVNLSVALAKLGYSVGLIDADIFGPSIPKMFGLEDFKPEVKEINGKNIIVPALKYDVKLLSIGFFVAAENALIWRGPMATGALKQLILDAQWGELDYLLIDLPPGTSDIHLTLVQTVPITGAIIVSTPQSVSLADAEKGIAMFRADKIDVPVLGIVENMAWFTPKELPENKYYIFGKDGCKSLTEKYQIPLLAQIPIVQSICESGDNGMPIVLEKDSIIGKIFIEFSNRVVAGIEERIKTLSPSKTVEIHNKRFDK